MYVCVCAFLISVCWHPRQFGGVGLRLRQFCHIDQLCGSSAIFVRDQIWREAPPIQPSRLLFILDVYFYFNSNLN